GSTQAKLLVLLAGAGTFFVADTVPVAIILGLAEGAHVLKTWKEIALLTFPFLVLSSGVVSMAATAAKFLGWEIPLAMFPVMAMTYFSFRRYFAGTKAEPKKDQNLTLAAANSA